MVVVENFWTVKQSKNSGWQYFLSKAMKNSIENLTFSIFQIPNNPCIGLPNEILTNNSRGCEYFFYCRNGEAIEGFCPNNMWFNIDAGICDQPKNVYCTFDGNPSNADGNAENEDERVSCSLNIPTQIEQFIPSKIDCGRYFICYHGQPIRQHCISDLHWNVVENKCDQPNNARCQVNIKE